MSPGHDDNLHTSALYTHRITKLQIKNFPLALNGSSGVHMKLSLYHGSTELCEALVSTTKLRGSEINWVEMFQFDIEIRNIPKVLKYVLYRTSQEFYYDMMLILTC